MSWRLAKSLEILRNQVNEAYPNRSRLSDGTIGDQAHAASSSDHNPNSQGVVCALDLTHNPPYFDAHKLAEILIIHRHPNLKYVISNSRIAGGWSQWRWVGYAGSNPHDKHIHISVGVGQDGQSQPSTYDNETKWSIGGNMPASQDQVDELVVRLLYNLGEFRQPSQAEVDNWVKPGFKVEEVARAILDAPMHKALQQQLAGIKDDDEEQIKEAMAKLQEAIND